MSGVLVQLTVREREVAALVTDGLTNGQISSHLKVSQRTVDNCLQQIYRKVGTSTRSQLAAYLLSGDPVATARSQPAYAGELPTPLSSFVGREEELVEVGRLVASNRLLTLLGPGGVGKTRLAIQVARIAKRSYNDGLYFVRLSGVAERDLVEEAVLAGIGLHLDVNRRPRDIVADYLRGRPALLVLDSCEHVIETTAPLVEHLLTTCWDLHILATSREPLMLAVEHVRQVLPLELPRPGERLLEDAIRRHSALRLFVERAQMAGGTLPIRSQDAHIIAQICQRLDGLPLALEIAAARTRTMSVAALLDRLQHHERFRVLTAGYRTADERHRTLWATVEWSHRLLSAHERALFARLAAFAGSFDLHAGKQVGSLAPLGPSDVTELLSGLVDKSLVEVVARPTGECRYHMLDTLRAFGRERLLATGEDEPIRRRHAEHYAGVLAEPALTWTRAALDEMQDQLDDIRAALTWSLTNEPALTTLICGRLVGFWGRQGNITEGCQWLDRIIARLPDEDSHKAIAFANSSWLAQRHGSFEVAERRALEALRIARQIDDAGAVADALTRLGDIARNRGRQEEATRFGFEAVAMRRIQGDRLALGLALIVLGSAQGRQGSFNAGTQQLEEAILLFTAIDERGGIALAQASLGELAILEGNLPRAKELLSDSLRTYRELPDAWMVANLFDLFSWVAGIEDEPVRALRLASAATSLRKKIGAARIPALDSPLIRVVSEAQRWLRSRAEKSWREGAGATPEEAMAFALREVEWETLLNNPFGTGHGALTRREQQVASLIAQGFGDKEIAMRLAIGVRTAEHHADQIRKKLGCTSRARVAVWVVRARSTADYGLRGRNYLRTSTDLGGAVGPISSTAGSFCAPAATKCGRAFNGGRGQ